jgi:hypothetical protein
MLFPAQDGTITRVVNDTVDGGGQVITHDEWFYFEMNSLDFPVEPQNVEVVGAIYTSTMFRTCTLGLHVRAPLVNDHVYRYAENDFGISCKDNFYPIHAPNDRTKAAFKGLGPKAVGGTLLFTSLPCHDLDITAVSFDLEVDLFRDGVVRNLKGTLNALSGLHSVRGPVCPPSDDK